MHYTVEIEIQLFFLRAERKFLIFFDLLLLQAGEYHPVSCTFSPVLQWKNWDGSFRKAARNQTVAGETTATKLCEVEFFSAKKYMAISADNVK